jgi:hypothetical protein
MLGLLQRETGRRYSMMVCQESAWPSGLRRQTQAKAYPLCEELGVLVHECGREFESRR